jgi:hypothetical protein
MQFGLSEVFGALCLAAFDRALRTHTRRTIAQVLFRGPDSGTTSGSFSQVRTATHTHTPTRMLRPGVSSFQFPSAGFPLHARDLLRLPSIVGP